MTEVVTAAFGQRDEAELVQRLRGTPEHLPELCLVAETDDRVVGHIAFSRVTLEPGGSLGVALAPVSVLPDHQGTGVGAALISEGLETARQLGERFVVLLGHAEYYPKFGFEPADAMGVGAPWDVPSNAWMIHLLGSTTRPEPGTVRYSSAFSA